MQKFKEPNQFDLSEAVSLSGFIWYHSETTLLGDIPISGAAT
jgi:hypothetical protein